MFARGFGGLIFDVRCLRHQPRRSQNPRRQKEKKKKDKKIKDSDFSGAKKDTSSSRGLLANSVIKQSK